MTAQFSIGEWVARKMDNQIGRVVQIEPYDQDFVFYVDFGDRELWAGTTVAWRSAYTTHAHVSHYSRDCDGDYSSGATYELTLAERTSEFPDLEFKSRVMSNAVTFHGYGTLEVTPEGFSWYERTEEGFRATEVRWCEDDCGDDLSWQRDHSAEKAGY